MHVIAKEQRDRGNLMMIRTFLEITTGFLPFALWAKQSLFKIVPYDFMLRFTRNDSSYFAESKKFFSMA